MSIDRDDVRIGKGHAGCTLARGFSTGRSLVTQLTPIIQVTTGTSPDIACAVKRAR